jgi:alpha-ketoglutarate-dependent taurine dioxygenase
MLLKFLYDHLAYSQDLHCRVKWAPNTVVVWDNRVTAHSALIDWENGSRRRKFYLVEERLVRVLTISHRHRENNAPS